MPPPKILPQSEAELERRRLSYLRGREPNFLLPPPASTRARLRALQLLHRGKLDEGLDLLEEANAGAEDFAGAVDGREVEGWRDEDDWLGDTLELSVGGKVHWLPMVQVRSLKLAGRERLVGYWLGAEIQLVGTAEALSAQLPIRYVQSDTHSEAGVRQAEEMDLYSDEAGCTRCLGLRSWLIGGAEFSPWEFRQIERRGGRIGLA